MKFSFKNIIPSVFFVFSVAFFVSTRDAYVLNCNAKTLPTK